MIVSINDEGKLFLIFKYFLPNLLDFNVIVVMLKFKKNTVSIEYHHFIIQHEINCDTMLFALVCSVVYYWSPVLCGTGSGIFRTHNQRQ